MGMRLYDALIGKLDREGERTGVPTRAELIEIRDEERAHVEMLADIITELGGDPALVSPAAAREAIVLHGISGVIDDPACGFADGLEAIVILELADHEQWVCLVELAREIRRDDLARSFLTAQSNEHKHLSKMRAWISAERALHRTTLQ
jgi:rubrerythrin